jgi:hypothetical protein
MMCLSWQLGHVKESRPLQLANCLNESLVLALAIAHKEGINCILNCNSDYRVTSQFNFKLHGNRKQVLFFVN